MVSEKKKTVEGEFVSVLIARSLTLVPRSLLLNRTETLATQAKQTDEVRAIRKKITEGEVHNLQ